MSDQENPNNQEKNKKPGEALVGKVLFDRFEVLEVLGESAMALVLKAREISTDRLVAIKTVTPHDPETVRRFAQEVQLHGSLKHANIVEAIDSLEAAGGRTFFIMEFLPGASLQRVLQTHTRLDNENELASILLQVCDALAHAHRFGVLHRDLKPGNIFLLEQDNKLNVKVLDFGIAKPLGQQTGLTQAGYSVGSPLYMSPEQCRGHQVDTRSDVYSLGILAYEMTTGQLPYGGHNIMTVMAAHCDPDRKPNHLNTHVPNLRCVDKLNTTIQMAMETDPAKRFQTITDFRNSVQQWHDAVQKEFLSTLIPGQPRNVVPDMKTAVAEQVSRSAAISTTDSAPKVPASESLIPSSLEQTVRPQSVSPEQISPQQLQPPVPQQPPVSQQQQLASPHQAPQQPVPPQQVQQQVDQQQQFFRHQLTREEMQQLQQAQAQQQVEAQPQEQQEHEQLRQQQAQQEALQQQKQQQELQEQQQAQFQQQQQELQEQKQRQQQQEEFEKQKQQQAAPQLAPNSVQPRLTTSRQEDNGNVPEIEEEDEETVEAPRYGRRNIEQTTLSGGDQKSRLRSRLSVSDVGPEPGNKTKVIAITVIAVMTLLLIALGILAKLLLQ